MGIFPGFTGWINLNIQQPPKDESKSTENVESQPKPPIDPKYYDKDEVLRQHKLWQNAEKKHPWDDPPPTVKVTTKNGVCHMNVEMTIGLPPESTYEMFADPNSQEYFRDVKKGLTILESKTRKILKKDGPREIVELKKALAWQFLWWSGPIPIQLIADENQKELTGKYKKKKMMFMKVFDGKWKIEPLFVDSERLCKNRKPKSQEEYKNCSGGQGKIGSKVIMEQRFQPSALLNLPPVSWYIREITIKTTKNLLEDIKSYGSVLRTDPESNVPNQVIYMDRE